MKKILFLTLSLFGLAGAAHAVTPIRTVQISTAALSQQTGSYNVYSGTMSVSQITTLSGVKTITGTDSITFSTGSVTAATGTFSGALVASSNTLTTTSLKSTTTVTGPILDKNLSAGTTFDYLNSQSSGTTAAPQWSHFGLVLQSSASMATAISSATTSATFVKTGFAITISPKFANSKIRIWFSGDIRSSNVAGDFAFITLERNASNLASGGGSNYMAGFSASTVTGTLQVPASFVVYDTPNVTTAVTYEIYIRTSTGGATGTLCAGTACQMIVEEIGQ